MLYAFGFERVGVLCSDMYVLIPDPLPGQEGAERGVRLEVRLLERGELRGNMFSSRPIEVGRSGARTCWSRWPGRRAAWTGRTITRTSAAGIPAGARSIPS